MKLLNNEQQAEVQAWLEQVKEILVNSPLASPEVKASAEYWSLEFKPKRVRRAKNSVESS